MKRVNAPSLSYLLQEHQTSTSLLYYGLIQLGQNHCT